jgi:hypothetical protein
MQSKDQDGCKALGISLHWLKRGSICLSLLQLNHVRLRELDEQFTELLQAEEEFPPQLPDMKDLYTNFYNGMTGLADNMVCASCGCIGHHSATFTSVSTNDSSLRLLQVIPSLVPFDFKSGIMALDSSHIMIDPNGIIDEASLHVCHTCYKSLRAEVLPPQSLANYRWIGPVPHQLQDLTWIEELLISRAHLTGRIVRLQNRNSTSHFSLKGHMILLPQDTTKLLDILPLPESNLPDIVRVVWVGKPVQEIDRLRDYFSVRTRKVYDALVWLTQNNEDYKDVTIDHGQFERWPPVWVAENLLELAGVLDAGGQEDNSRIGVASEDSDDVEMSMGDVQMTASGIIDTTAVSEPAQLRSIQQISLSKSDQTINVLTGNCILNEDTISSYFTSAFPTIFPWGTGKHIDARRSQQRNEKLGFNEWIKLLLRNSSRYTPSLAKLNFFRRFQGHRGFVVLCFDLVRRRHSLRKTNLITSRDHWETTRPLLQSLTEERLTTAAQQAARHMPISDAGVKKLLAMVNTIGMNDPGSEERKSQLLARLKSATVYYGLPQIFITLNPADNISPLALFYAGERIDIKSFHPHLYTAGHRLKTMLDNPLSVVEYFRNTIDTIIETMLRGGMFGDLIHYYGPIEYQGRGTPHAHIVVRISSAPAIAKF